MPACSSWCCTLQCKHVTGVPCNSCACLIAHFGTLPSCPSIVTQSWLDRHMYVSMCATHAPCRWLHVALAAACLLYLVPPACMLHATHSCSESQHPACCRLCPNTHGSQCYSVTAAVVCLVSWHIDVLHQACTAWKAHMWERQALVCQASLGHWAHKASQAVPMLVAGVPRATVQPGSHPTWAHITRQHRWDSAPIHSTAQQADKSQAWIEVTNPGGTPPFASILLVLAAPASVSLLERAGVCRSALWQQMNDVISVLPLLTLLNLLHMNCNLQSNLLDSSQAAAPATAHLVVPGQQYPCRKDLDAASAR